jgi:hypothetical protein
MGMRTPKRTILVLSQHTRGGVESLMWWNCEGIGAERATQQAALAISRPLVEHVTFLELHVSLRLTDGDVRSFIHQLGPAIRARQIGKIHGKRDRVPLERPMLGQAGVTS